MIRSKPNHGNMHRRETPFNLDLLSPNMIERWTVRAKSKDAAVGDVVNWLRQK